MSVDLPQRSIDPNELYVAFMHTLLDYLQNPGAEQQQKVRASAGQADWAVNGYWSDHGPFQDDLESRVQRLLDGHPDEWVLLVNSLTGVPQELADQFRQLVPPNLQPLTPDARERYAKVTRRHVRRGGPGISFEQQMTGL